MRSVAALLTVAAGAAGTPTMTLLKKCDGDAVVAAKDVDYAGNFKIRVSVAGKNGFTYTCDSTYDAKAETADKECAGWLPQEVLSGEEDLDITLDALDAGGKRAVCMQWQLAFGAAPEEAAGEASTDLVQTAREFFDSKFKPVRAAKPLDVPGFHNSTGGYNNTPATRQLVAHAYLDSMTYVSHACVSKKMNDELYPMMPLPYQGDELCAADSKQCVDDALTGIIYPPLLRVAHKALAISGVIHSIDRKCKEAWKLGKGSDGTSSQSCVSFPYLHCHTECDMTWHFGPGGVATWGMNFVNHHIPSPSIIIFQQIRKAANAAKFFGDLGCGNHNPTPPAEYRCKDSKCVATKGGVDIDTCKAAC